MSSRKPGPKPKGPSRSVDAPKVAREKRVTPEMLVMHLNDINAGAKCTFCGVGDYAVPSDPDGKSASMVATPAPQSKNFGLWLYTAVCVNCNHVIFFHAPRVAAVIIRD